MSFRVKKNSHYFSVRVILFMILFMIAGVTITDWICNRLNNISPVTYTFSTEHETTLRGF